VDLKIECIIKTWDRIQNIRGYDEWSSRDGRTVDVMYVIMVDDQFRIKFYQYLSSYTYFDKSDAICLWKSTTGLPSKMGKKYYKMMYKRRKKIENF